jgi:hypothetical protein
VWAIEDLHSCTASGLSALSDTVPMINSPPFAGNATEPTGGGTVEGDEGSEDESLQPFNPTTVATRTIPFRIRMAPSEDTVPTMASQVSGDS